MKVLLDTNIIIHREASKVINKDIGILFNWIDKLGYIKCVHPLTESEISRYADSDVVNAITIKLDSYNVLRTIAPVADKVNEISAKCDITPNDVEDTKLLNEVYCDRVDILISEDKKIHYKASLLGIAERVYRIDSFLEKVNAENPNLVDYKVLHVKKDYFGHINLQDPFFDTFRQDYHGFDAWFNKKADENAYICYDKGEFRRAIFKDTSVDKVYVYASHPVQKVIGEFEIENVLNSPINNLWEQTKGYSGITKDYFLQYFNDKEKGYAIKIKNYKRYKTPLCIRKDFNASPPQSFVYVDRNRQTKLTLFAA